MITAHVFQLCYSGDSKFVSVFSLYINMVTFSSFMFCFGCSSQLAYIGRFEDRKCIKNKLLKNFIRLLVSFYISGYAYLVFIENNTSILDFLKVLFLWKIPGYSEFLLSFAMINMVIYIFYFKLRDISVNKYKSGGVILFSLVSTFIPYGIIIIPLIGTFIGTTKYACFPILQYLPFFIIGIYCQCNNAFVDKRLWLCSTLATVFVTMYVFFTHNIPQRFPPSLLWILWPSMFTLLYYWISHKLSGKIKHGPIKTVIDVFGAFTLDYLVISNLLIFSIRRIYGKSMEISISLVFAILILSICFFYGFVKMQNRKIKN